MGAPSINISFIEKAISAITRGERGIVALALKDSVLLGQENAFTVYTVADIPVSLSDANKEYIKKTLLGYQYAPKKVICYVMDEDGTLATEYTAMLNYMSMNKFNYLVIPTVTADSKTSDIVSWVNSMRTTGSTKRTVKAVLPNATADSDGIINVTTGYYVGSTHVEAPEACCRVAGILAGTPITISCTYAPIPEATDCDRSSDIDGDVDAGKFIFMWDGEKVKVCRGVTSFHTTTADKGDSFKKIKLVEAMDMMYDDIVITAQDSYIGKYANSYDNKCLLITAINGYFAELIKEGVLSVGVCSVDVESQRNYLQQKGGKVILHDGTEKDLEDCSDEEIKKADTGSHVFLKAVVKILDAIEDIDLDIYI